RSAGLRRPGPAAGAGRQPRPPRSSATSGARGGTPSCPPTAPTTCPPSWSRSGWHTCSTSSSTPRTWVWPSRTRPPSPPPTSTSSGTWTACCPGPTWRSSTTGRRTSRARPPSAGQRCTSASGPDPGRDRGRTGPRGTALPSGGAGGDPADEGAEGLDGRGVPGVVEQRDGLPGQPGGVLGGLLHGRVLAQQRQRLVEVLGWHRPGEELAQPGVGGVGRGPGVEHGQRRLALPQVGAGGLARALGLGGDVEQVVGELEDDAELLPERRERLYEVGGAPAELGAVGRRGRDERAGLVGQDADVV